MDAKAFGLTIARAQAEAKSNMSPSATTSIMKNAGSKLQQERAELLMEIMGAQGLGWEGEGFAADEIMSTRAWLGGKAVTIYGGSYEIQNNIIAKRILGLLDHQGTPTFIPAKRCGCTAPSRDPSRSNLDGSRTARWRAFPG